MIRGHPGPIGVYLQDGAYHPRSRYILEVLGHAGILFARIDSAGLAEALLDTRVALLPHHTSPPDVEAMHRFVASGGALVALGGTSGLDDLCGVQSQSGLHEGFLRVTQPHHVVVRDLHSSLHVWDAATAQVSGATVLAELTDADGKQVGVGISEHRQGRGLVLFTAADLPWCILHMLQGIPIFQDGVPAPDGTADIDDGRLNVEDGMVLDWDRDRTHDTEVPFFLEAIGDELRAILLRSVFYCATHARAVFPLLWYWPGDLTAIAHLSHDSDGNQIEKAWHMLERVQELGIKSTWCILYPGYTRQFYDAVRSSGSELALHFDARIQMEHTRWRFEDLRFQWSYLKQEAGLDAVITNKNHGLRWEGYLEFFHWLTKLGVATDQTKGPNRRGNTGYLVGSSHPWFPMDPDSGVCSDVLEVNLLTQDLMHPVSDPDARQGWLAPYSAGPLLLDRVQRHYGIAHYLFHPNHVLRPGVPTAMTDLVQLVSTRGLPWWQSYEINAWERARRAVRFTFDDRHSIHLTAETQLQDACILVHRPRGCPLTLRVNGEPQDYPSVERYGFLFAKVIVELDQRRTSLHWEGT